MQKVKCAAANKYGNYAIWDKARLTREVLEDFRISMEQFKRGEGIPLDEFVAETREKYGL